MIVYVPVKFYEYEGFSEPTIAFKTEEAAKAWTQETIQQNTIAEWEIIEIEVKEK